MLNIAVSWPKGLFSTHFHWRKKTKSRACLNSFFIGFYRAGMTVSVTSNFPSVTTVLPAVDPFKKAAKILFTEATSLSGASVVQFAPCLASLLRCLSYRPSTIGVCWKGEGEQGTLVGWSSSPLNGSWRHADEIPSSPVSCNYPAEHSVTCTPVASLECDTRGLFDS